MGLVIPHYTSLGIPHIKKTKTKKLFTNIWKIIDFFLNKFKKIVFSTNLKEPDSILNKRGRGAFKRSTWKD